MSPFPNPRPPSAGAGRGSLFEVLFWAGRKVCLRPPGAPGSGTVEQVPWMGVLPFLQSLTSGGGPSRQSHCPYWDDVARTVLPPG